MTTAIDPSITLAELVTQRPALARELERRSLDYCCGGQRSLADACRAFVGSTSTTPPPRWRPWPRPTRPDWATFGPAELVDHLEATHHAYLHDGAPAA